MGGELEPPRAMRSADIASRAADTWAHHASRPCAGQAQAWGRAWTGHPSGRKCRGHPHLTQHTAMTMGCGLCWLKSVGGGCGPVR